MSAIEIANNIRTNESLNDLEHNKQFYDENNVDIVMPWFVFQDNPLEETIVKHLAEFSKKKKKPILVGGNGGPYTKKMSKLIEKQKIPVFDDLRIWIAAASALHRFGRNL